MHQNIKPAPNCEADAVAEMRARAQRDCDERGRPVRLMLPDHTSEWLQPKKALTIPSVGGESVSSQPMSTDEAGKEDAAQDELDQLLADLTSGSAPTGDDTSAPTVCETAAASGVGLPEEIAAVPAAPEAAPAPSSPTAATKAAIPPFPVACVEEVASDSYSLADLQAMCHKAVRTPEGYMAARDAYCRASLSLNIAGCIAPAGRPQIVVAAKAGDPIHMLIHRDRMVIDYHWCHAARMGVSPIDDQHGKLFHGGLDFDLAVAWELTGRTWKRAYRASEALALTTLQQCQTLSLRGQKVSERAAKVKGQYRESNGKLSSPKAAAFTKIREWAERDPRIKQHVRVYEALWEARELLGPEHEGMVPELLAVLTGKSVLDRKTIRDKLKKLSLHVKL